LIAEFETQIIVGLQSTLYQFGWLVMAGPMSFENATGLIPSEIPLSLASWGLVDVHDELPTIVLIGGLYVAPGSLAGSSITYWMVRLGGRPFANKWLNIAILWEIVLLFLIIYVPFLHDAFGTFYLPLVDWAIVLVLALTISPVLELAKWMVRRGWFGKMVSQ